MSLRLFILIIFSVLTLGGCSKYMPKLDKVLPDQRDEYKKSQSLPDLEVPPDLTTESIDDSLAVPDIDESGSASFSEYEERVVRQKEAKKYATMDEASAISDLAGEQLFIVKGDNIKTWGALQDFWKNLGYTLTLNDQELGVMETGWKNDPGKQKRDRFKVFIEPAQTVGQTAVYLSHSGENLVEGVWEERNRDLPVEKSMAVRLQSALGGAPAVGNTATLANGTSSTDSGTTDNIQAELLSAGEGKMYLAVLSDFASTWPLVGQILSGSVDIRIEDENQEKGTYHILYQAAKDTGKKKGVLSKLAFWKGGNNEFQLQLTGVGNKTEIVVLDEDGEWDTSESAKDLLQRIKSEL